MSVNLHCLTTETNLWLTGITDAVLGRLIVVLMVFSSMIVGNAQHLHVCVKEKGLKDTGGNKKKKRIKNEYKIERELYFQMGWFFLKEFNSLLGSTPSFRRQSHCEKHVNMLLYQNKNCSTLKEKKADLNFS